MLHPLVLSLLGTVSAIQTSNPTWETMVAPAVNSLRFSARNGHASCVFKGEIWVTGGRSSVYTRYNLKQGFKTADVWRSSDGETNLLGDYYAQNADAVQPGPIAPWYVRFGHSLTPLDLNNDGVDDIMMLLGGYAPQPSNDIWITEDGVTWAYCGKAPWPPRAWHAATVFMRKLYVMGGTPLNNDVWYLDIGSIQKIPRIEAPLTRAFYLNYTYNMSWSEEPNAPWSPRAGLGAIAQFYFNESTQTVGQGAYRLLVIGGYGGWLERSAAVFPYSVGDYDGFRCREDVWSMDSTGSWELLTNNASFQARAWFGLVSSTSPSDPRLDIGSNLAPRLFLFGGGNIGFSTTTSALLDVMDGKVDAFVSRDGITWTHLNYQEGGGTTQISLYSSQEWAKTKIQGSIVYVGLWGMTVHSYDYSNISGVVDRRFVMVAGDQTGQGSHTNLVYRSLTYILCETNGVTCSNRGTCSNTTKGCICNQVKGIIYSGEYCQDAIFGSSWGLRSVSMSLMMIMTYCAIITYAIS